MAKQVLISIGAGRYQTSVILTGQKLGYDVVAVDIDPNAVSLQYANQAIVASAHSSDQTLRAIRQLLPGRDIAGVVTQAARGCITTTAIVAKALGCPHLDVAAATLSLEKNKLIRQFHPEVLSQTINHPQDKVNDLSYPLLIKHDEGSGSTGIQVINHADDMATILAADSQRFPIHCHKLIVGRHFGVIGLATNTGFYFYGVLEQFVNEDFRIQETILPATMTEENEKMILRTAQQYLERIGLNLGPFQVELIQDEDGEIYLAEIEASILGSHISDKMIPGAGQNDFIMDSIKTLTQSEFTPDIQSNMYQMRNKFPNTASNPGSQHVFSRKKFSGSNNNSVIGI